ncbi:hypothetical protein HMPREF3127_20050 [Sphingobacterium sp. HMSC13C05]|nr:hypothetical protein HMPREF3127_20050 [Sphingobacterium sp. HMSC13C05]
MIFKNILKLISNDSKPDVIKISPNYIATLLLTMIFFPIVYKPQQFLLDLVLIIDQLDRF